MRPEGMIEGELPFRARLVHQNSGVALHLDAEFSLQVLFPLVEGSDSHSHNDTHLFILSRSLEPWALLINQNGDHQSKKQDRRTEEEERGKEEEEAQTSEGFLEED